MFSGYSFTDLLWIDRQGRLHEGKVPEDQLEDLWGVGFYHNLSRDSFLTLRLEHRGEGGVSPKHTGEPRPMYKAHGEILGTLPPQKDRYASGVGGPSEECLPLPGL